MKKLFILLVTLSASHYLFASPLADQVSAAFVGNAKLSIETTSGGQDQVEFLDNVFEVGNLGAEHILAGDIGALGDILPGNGQFSGVDWTVGAKIHISPLIKNLVSLPPEWQFLNTLEMDARVSYDFVARHDRFGISMAYPFK